MTRTGGARDAERNHAAAQALQDISQDDKTSRKWAAFVAISDSRVDSTGLGLRVSYKGCFCGHL